MEHQSSSEMSEDGGEMTPIEDMPPDMQVRPYINNQCKGGGQPDVWGRGGFDQQT